MPASGSGAGGPPSGFPVLPDPDSTRVPNGQNRLRALLEDLPVGLYRTTPGGTFLEANTAMARSGVGPGHCAGRARRRGAQVLRGHRPGRHGPEGGGARARAPGGPVPRPRRALSRHHRPLRPGPPLHVPVSAGGEADRPTPGFPGRGDPRRDAIPQRARKDRGRAAPCGVRAGDPAHLGRTLRGPLGPRMEPLPSGPGARRRRPDDRIRPRRRPRRDGAEARPGGSDPERGAPSLAHRECRGPHRHRGRLRKDRLHEPVLRAGARVRPGRAAGRGRLRPDPPRGPRARPDRPRGGGRARVHRFPPGGVSLPAQGRSLAQSSGRAAGTSTWTAPRAWASRSPALGHRVIAADSGLSALRRFRRRFEPVDLLVTDVVMPGIAGPDLAKSLRQLRPDLPVLYISGYAPEETLARGAHLPGDRFLEKPFTLEELGARVRRALTDTNAGGGRRIIPPSK